MRKGALVTGIITLIALSGIMVAFVSNASPYVTIAQARTLKGDEVHVVGDIDKATLKVDALKNEVAFDITDEKGDRIAVHYAGPPPANMGEAKQVVVSGSVDDAKIEASKLLLKCPSKYEAQAQQE